MDSQLILKWVKEGIITKAQAKRMLADVSVSKKENTSNKFIVTLSTVGSILLGIGAILFIASNWNALSSLVKVLILAASTFGAYYAGYVLRYQKQSLPKVGTSLLFLGALLFGASVFLIAQIYHVNANAHSLLLVWLAGILPLVYALASTPIAVLASVLFLLWSYSFFFLNSSSFFGFLEGFATRYFPPVMLVTGVALFGIGGLHYLNEKFKSIARVYRLAGLKMILFSLFLLTFDFYSQKRDSYYSFNEEITGRVLLGFGIFSAIAVISLFANWFFNKSKEVSKIEGPVSAALMALVLVFHYYPSSTTIYVVIFNLVLAGLIFLMFYTGYEREDMKLVNMGMFWLVVFVIVKYFDFFWRLLPRSLFFIVGGLILVLGGIALEKKRRDIRVQFANG